MAEKRRTGERMNSPQKQSTAKPTAPAWLTKPPEPGWRYRVIGITALIFGVGGGLLGWKMNGNPADNVTYALGLAMLMPTYFTIPRTKTLRMWQGSVAGILGGLIVMAILFLFATGTFWPLRNELFVGFGGYVPGVIAWSWVMTWVTGKTEKKRMDLDARKAEREANIAKENKKSSVQYDKNGKPIRVHRYNRKKGKR